MTDIRTDTHHCKLQPSEPTYLVTVNGICYTGTDTCGALKACAADALQCYTASVSEEFYESDILKGVNVVVCGTVQNFLNQFGNSSTEQDALDATNFSKDGCHQVCGDSCKNYHLCYQSTRIFSVLQFSNPVFM